MAYTLAIVKVVITVTPSHKQQSVPSFHDSVLGCWQFHEAELSMEKEQSNLRLYTDEIEVTDRPNLKYKSE
ncbi:hypothetical protein NC653_028618 [Populus alba x Populus x berolinensis]|uniref:Uncharacterized protein n=1 Tax=Populus alba x Populus x berolinensis TaxID=444605 RepID=A0AAD6M099_9ROSI|nr:hypothetical protein NC653_028618 [Populus alba x Populus x berolinensis]